MKSKLNIGDIKKAHSETFVNSQMNAPLPVQQKIHVKRKKMLPNGTEYDIIEIEITGTNLPKVKQIYDQVRKELE